MTAIIIDFAKAAARVKSKRDQSGMRSRLIKLAERERRYWESRKAAERKRRMRYRKNVKKYLERKRRELVEQGSK